ncbi:deoxyribonuclease IV [Planctopirus ephydatiae]|uniref:deoxyribonuclease IV n=1 Tax=Planctopirus ephydatiae TaxID=2528019 RepID=UPI0036F1D20F
MPVSILGAHMSIAGGYYKALEAGHRLGMGCVQLFTKNNNQWRGKPLTEDDIRQFQTTWKSTGIQATCAHASYLINLASPDDVLWNKSCDALRDELERAEALGIPGVVLHPGSAVKSTPEAGIVRVIEALDDVHSKCKGFRTQVWLETTAGQGSCLGARFEELSQMLDGVREPDRIGICIDTCHIFAAGYPLHTADDYADTLEQFSQKIGLGRVRAFHVNDSMKGLGSRVDRHAHIGEGQLGRIPFSRLLHDARLTHIPKYLETEKGERNGVDLDLINLQTLQQLIANPEHD